ncbi:MAG: efflux RND transporter periplasmic adaptor subunit, partial [Bacteroidetes bacterium]|nr:efflux RND transporter periplasmic adaptor subunit [Bacteroidota bacterium]
IYDKQTEFSLKAAKSRFLNGIANILPDFKIDYPESYPKIKKYFDDIRIDKPLPDLPVIESEKERIFLASRNILNDYFNIKSSEILLAKHSIRAPFTGTYTDVMLEVGSIANPGSRIARIISTGQLELEVPVVVEDVGWLKKGQSVNVSSEDGEKHWIGKIVRISDFVDPNSQSVSVFVSLEPSPENPLYEGQYLRAVFNGRKIKNAMKIPRRAVFNSNEVFVVKDSVLAKEIVNVIKINQETLIFNGLEEGAIIVAEPLVGTSEGSKVNVLL